MPRSEQVSSNSQCQTLQKRSSPQDHAHCAPTVKRVQQTHPAILVFKGACFHNGAYLHFHKTTADSIKYHRNKKPLKGNREHFWKNCQHHKPGCRSRLGSHYTGAVTNFVCKPALPQDQPASGSDKTHRGSWQSFPTKSHRCFEKSKTEEAQS